MVSCTAILMSVRLCIIIIKLENSEQMKNWKIIPFSFPRSFTNRFDDSDVVIKDIIRKCKNF